MITYVPPIGVDAVWDRVEEQIGPALSDEITLNDVKRKLLDGKMGLLLIDDKASCIVETIKYAQLKALRVVALGGSGMDEWLSQLVEFMDTWAMYLGCKRIEQMGRKGWVKKLADYGYCERYIFMTKDVDNG